MTPMLDTVVKIAEPRDAQAPLCRLHHRQRPERWWPTSAPPRPISTSRCGRCGAWRCRRSSTRARSRRSPSWRRRRRDRKALVILGDGNSDDTSYDHDPVVKAAKDAGVIIHALGFAAEASDQPKFQYIRRLAEETGGFRREVRVGSSQKYTISNQFVAEALENGGTATITPAGAAGPGDAQHHRRFQQRPLRERASSASRCRRRRRSRASPSAARSSPVRAGAAPVGLVPASCSPGRARTRRSP